VLLYYAKNEHKFTNIKLWFFTVLKKRNVKLWLANKRKLRNYRKWTVVKNIYKCYGENKI